MAAPDAGATVFLRPGRRGPGRGLRSATAPPLVLAVFLAQFGLCRLVWADPALPAALNGQDPLPAAGWAVVALAGSVVYRVSGTVGRRDLGGLS